MVGLVLSTTNSCAGEPQVPDGKMIAGADNNGTVILWDTATGREIRQREDNSEYPDIVFAPSGKTYAASDKQGARLWDTASSREIRRFPTSGKAARPGCSASRRTARRWLSPAAMLSGSGMLRRVACSGPSMKLIGCTP
jgi:WD40 repeat protein